jgi:hypothetical protein
MTCVRSQDALYSSPIIIRVIRSRRLRWAGNVALWCREEVYIGFCWGNLWEGGLMEDPGLNRRIILK